MTSPDMERLLAPKRVAVIGATSRATGLGRRIIDHLTQARFAGEVIDADPTAALEIDVDVAAIAVPAAHAQAVLERVAPRARHAIVLSSGFEEAGADRLIAPAGTTLIGPNSVGCYAHESRLVLTFAKAFDDMVDCPPGHGAFLISQSGAFGARIARAAHAEGFPLDGFIGTGNETQTTAATLGRALLSSERRPRVLMMYLETARDIDELIRMLEDARAAGVPVVVLYGGRTRSGASAAASHTSALSTDFDILGEVLRTLGAHIVRSDRELLIAARTLAHTPSASGARVAIVTGSGGAGVVVADSLEERGLSVPPFSEKLQGALMEMLPAFASAANPVDVTAQAVADAALVGRVCAAIARSGEADAVLAIGRDSYASELRGNEGTPMIVGLLDGITTVDGGDGVAVAADLDSAAAAVSAALTPDGTLDSLTLLRPRPHAMTQVPRASDSLRLFEEAEITVAPWRTATTVAEAVRAGEELGWPVVLKSDGDAAIHKALSGGVRLGVGPESIAAQAEDLLASAGRIIVASQLSASLELFVGIRHDETFGLVVTAGLGGSHVELMGRTVTVPAGAVTARLADRLRSQVFDRGGPRYASLAEQLTQSAERLLDLAGRGFALVEANPIGLVGTSLIALDARVVVHDADAS